MKSKSPENNVYARVMMLKTHLNLGQNEFCQAAKISTATYQRIKAHDETVRESTINDVCRNLNANQNWVLRGEGDMFNPEVESNPWREEAYRIKSEAEKFLKEQIALKDATIAALTTILTKANFRMPLNLTGPSPLWVIKSAR